jgi:hypothetical protein
MTIYKDFYALYYTFLNMNSQRHPCQISVSVANHFLVILAGNTTMGGFQNGYWLHHMALSFPKSYLKRL